MKKTLLFPFLICFLVSINLKASEKDSLHFQTQISFSGLYNPTSNSGMVNARGIPQLDYLRDFSHDRRISAEVSALLNWNGDVAASTINGAASMDLYRAWARFSTQRNEIRIGLQQLNFGSASLLRPLQWFDGLNPTDPLRMTKGVWGVLDRIYFNNNATLWFWGLYGNSDSRIWDYATRSTTYPEIGFRYQHPVLSGELALSLNHRTVQTTLGALDEYQETKIGLDGKWDLGLGLWFEDSYTMTSKNSPFKSGMNLLTIGSDITPSFLDGLSFTFEHMMLTTFSVDDDALNSGNFSALTANWPINIFHRISGIALYNWESQALFRYVTWSADFDRISVHLIGFWNPNLTSSILSLGSGYYSNYGFQLMYVLHL